MLSLQGSPYSGKIIDPGEPTPVPAQAHLYKHANGRLNPVHVCRVLVQDG